jgi:DNA modification methylase
LSFWPFTVFVTLWSLAMVCGPRLLTDLPFSFDSPLIEVGGRQPARKPTFRPPNKLLRFVRAVAVQGVLMPKPRATNRIGRRSRHLTKPSNLNSLIADPQNANRGTPRGAEMLAQSLRDYGAGRPVVIDRSGRVIAGNKTVEQAKRLGLPLKVVASDGHYLLAVQRTDLDLVTDAKARELALADNRIGQVNLEWDAEIMRQLQAEGVDLSKWWTDEEFATLIAGRPIDGLTDENAMVEPGPTDIRAGDLFVLGRHRLLCGDATSAVDVARLLDGTRPLLMVTDPPYGVAYDPAWRHRHDPSQRTAVGRVRNDDRADWTAALRLFPGPIAYVWHGGLMAATVATSLIAAGFSLRAQIIWRKQHFAFSRGDYHWQHEPCWYAVRAGRRGSWQGDRTQSTVWDVPNLNPMGGARSGENAVTGHATQKPVKVFEIPIANHTTGKDVLFDPFCGSGTALIAAEKLGRRCLAMDIDPPYVQAAITRWEQFTGRRAQRETVANARPRKS